MRPLSPSCFAVHLIVVYSSCPLFLGRTEQAMRPQSYLLGAAVPALSSPSYGNHFPVVAKLGILMVVRYGHLLCDVFFPPHFVYSILSSLVTLTPQPTTDTMPQL